MLLAERVTLSAEGAVPDAELRQMSRSNWLPLKSMIFASLSESFPEAYPVSVNSQTLRQNPECSTLRRKSQEGNWPAYCGLV